MQNSCGLKVQDLKELSKKVLIISISSQDEKNHSKGSTTKLALPFAITSLYTLYV